MACYHPLKGYRAKKPNPSGKYSIVFQKQEGFVDLPQEVPCGQCIGCRQDRTLGWAVRMTHEKQYHEQNCFITLTYAEENLPRNGCLHLPDFQKFLKRLRKVAPPLRFYHCGEYGEKFKRPHYHACIFGYDFPDKIPAGTRNGEQYYNSPLLEKLWPLGYSTVGELTYESAAYVARYITKKVTGKRKEEHYSFTDPETGEILQYPDEYATMSRRPGIGKGWYDKYKTDVFPGDFVVMHGVKIKTPNFYKNRLEIEEPEAYKLIRAKRQVAMEANAHENTFRRLQAREAVHLAKIKNLKRSYESGS